MPIASRDFVHGNKFVAAGKEFEVPPGETPEEYEANGLIGQPPGEGPVPEGETVPGGNPAGSDSPQGGDAANEAQEPGVGTLAPEDPVEPEGDPADPNKTAV